MTTPKLEPRERDASGSTTIRISKATRAIVAELRAVVEMQRHRHNRQRSEQHDWSSSEYLGTSRLSLRDDDLIYESVHAALLVGASSTSTIAVVDESRRRKSSTSAVAAVVVDKPRRRKSSTTPASSTSGRSPARRRPSSGSSRRGGRGR